MAVDTVSQEDTVKPDNKRGQFYNINFSFIILTFYYINFIIFPSNKC